MMRIQAYTGETINIKLVVENLDTLVDAIGKFAVRGRDGEMVNKDCTIDDNALLIRMIMRHTRIPTISKSQKSKKSLMTTSRPWQV
jgi:hypothetical protein